MSKRHPQRKRIPRPKKASKASKAKKPRPLKKPIKCGHRFHTRCEKHGNPCAIEVDWPVKDERHRFKKELLKMGAPSHGKDSEHRCKKCMVERFEHSPHQQIPVEGLDKLQVERMRLDMGGFRVGNTEEE